MEEILHQLIGSLSQGYIYIYLRWFSRRISEPSTVVFRFALSKKQQKKHDALQVVGLPYHTYDASPQACEVTPEANNCGEQPGSFGMSPNISNL